MRVGSPWNCSACNIYTLYFIITILYSNIQIYTINNESYDANRLCSRRRGTPTSDRTPQSKNGRTKLITERILIRLCAEDSCFVLLISRGRVKHHPTFSRQIQLFLLHINPFGETQRAIPVLMWARIFSQSSPRFLHNSASQLSLPLSATHQAPLPARPPAPTKDTEQVVPRSYGWRWMDDGSVRVSLQTKLWVRI